MAENEISFLQKAQCAAKALVLGGPGSLVKDVPPVNIICGFVAKNIMKDKSCNAMAARENWDTIPKSYEECIGNLPDPCHGYGRSDITGQCLVQIR